MTDHSIFRGAATALVTPLTKDGVDYENFGRLIDWQIESGIDGLVICGTSGEGSTLSDREHREALEFAVKRANGRVPMIAGTGSNDIAYGIDLTKHACEIGYDAVLVVTPYYNKATQKGLIEHYTMVANSVKLPIIMYNVPSRTGCNILPETAAKLCKNVPNIVGIKEASGDISSGNDDQIIPILALGGKGVISVLSNIAPKQTHDICQAFFDGDTAKAAKLQIEAIPLVGALFCEVNPIPVKKAIELQGRDTGVVRRPLTEMEPQNAERLKKEMQAYNVL